jgi:hypothetical protein
VRTRRKVVLLGGGLAVAAAIAGAVAFGLTSFGGEEAEPPPTTQQLIESLVQGPSGPARAEAARLLASRMDRGAVREVVAARKPDAVALLRDRLIRAYELATRNPRRRAAAVGCLAEIDDRPSANAVVTALLEDVRASVRREAAAALGRMDASSTVVKRLVNYRETQKGPAVREVDRALVAIGRPVVAHLLSVITRDSWTLDVIAKIGRPAVLPMRRQLNRGTFTQQVAASYGLLAIRQTDPRAVRSAVRSIVTLMMRRLGTMNSEFEAAQVLASVGRPAFDVLVPLARKRFEDLQGIEKKQAPWSAFALAMLAKLNPTAAAPLFAALRKRDHELIADLYEVYLQLGRPGSEPALIGALDAHGDTIMALAFLHSGNPKLDRGARDWAARNGYTITEGPGQAPAGSWGNINTLDLG